MHDVDYLITDEFLKKLFCLISNVNIKNRDCVLRGVFSEIGVNYDSNWNLDEFVFGFTSVFSDKKWFDVLDFVEVVLRTYRRVSDCERKKYRDSVLYDGGIVSASKFLASSFECVSGFDGFEYDNFIFMLNAFFEYERIPFFIEGVCVKRCVLDSVSEIYYNSMVRTHSDSANSCFAKAFDVLCKHIDNYAEVGRLCANGLESLSKELLFVVGCKKKRNVDSKQLGDLAKDLFDRDGVFFNGKSSDVNVRSLMESFYAYVNNANVRHGKLDNDILNFESARFLFFTTMFIVQYLESYFDDNGDTK